MKHYFFIGIGGIGMSGLAKILVEKGNKVSGSDIQENRETEELGKIGAKIYLGHDASHISRDLDLVIVSSAIKPDNPEIAKANELGIKILTRSELLNEIITGQKSIAVTGTHGKTTTSAMITSILEEAGLDPTAVIGAEVSRIGGNSKSGTGDFAVAEVCEYQRAFLDVYPYAAIITNIEEDHLDCYKDLNDIISTFADFTTHIDKNGFLVVFGEDKNVEKATKNYKGKLITYGETPSNDWTISNIKTLEHKTTFTVTAKGVYLGEFELIIPGFHNILNAVAAICLSAELGVEIAPIKKALAEFPGADRRFQVLGELNGTIFIDDYGHHPTEIIATLEGAREFYPERRIIAVFQPHQHSRTRLLLEDFSKSFDQANIVLIPEIYAVRDSAEDIASISSRDLVEKINIDNDKAKYFDSYEETADYLKSKIQPNDLVITIGAGPVNKVAQKVLRNFS